MDGRERRIAELTGGKGGILTGIGSGEDLFALVDFRVIAETVNDITYGWDTGALVDEVWYGLVTFAVPVPPDPWAIVTLAASPLPSRGADANRKPHHFWQVCLDAR